MNLKNILEKLEIEPCESVVYFHIAADTLAPIAGVKEIFSAIDNYFDERSTICMPSFPFTGAGYFNYLNTNPVFDVSKTPCRVNLISEMFRRKEGVIRSIHPWCSVASKGYLSKHIVSSHHLDNRTFGPYSPFNLIMDNNGWVIGLGVDCNTNSFAHLPDDNMSKYYNFAIYEHKNRSLVCIDYGGHEQIVETNVVESNISKKIKPRLMKPMYRNESFYHEIVSNNIEFYAMKVKEFLDYTIGYNMDVVKSEGKPIYYL